MPKNKNETISVQPVCTCGWKGTDLPAILSLGAYPEGSHHKSQYKPPERFKHDVTVKRIK